MTGIITRMNRVHVESDLFFSTTRREALTYKLRGKYFHASHYKLDNNGESTHLVAGRPFTPLRQSAINRRRSRCAGTIVAGLGFSSIACAWVATVLRSWVGAGAGACLGAGITGD